jgi:hypothetical protein
MDSGRFDDLVRKLAGATPSRRRLGTGLVAAAAVVVGARGGPTAVARPADCPTGIKCGKECCAYGASCAGRGQKRQCQCPTGQVVCESDRPYPGVCESTACPPDHFYQPDVCVCRCECGASCCPSGAFCEEPLSVPGGRRCYCRGGVDPETGAAGDCATCIPSGQPPVGGTCGQVCCSGVCNTAGLCCSDISVTTNTGTHGSCKVATDCCGFDPTNPGNTIECVNGYCTF